MAQAIKIFDEVGVERLAGDADFPDGLDATGVSTPDSTTGNTDPITIETGSTAGSAFDTGDITIATGDADPLIGGNAGDILIQGGDGDAGGGNGGRVTLQPGTGDTRGEVVLNTPSGAPIVRVHNNGVTLHDPNGVAQLDISTAGIAIADSAGALAFFGGAPAAKQTVAGALSAVVDPAAQAVLTSIIAALAGGAGYSLVVDGTT